MLMKIYFSVLTAILLLFNVSISEPQRIDNSYSEEKYINDITFQYINKIYSDIDFSANFNLGDHSVYDDYKEQYFKLLDRKIPFKSEGKNYYIDEYIGGDYEPEKYTYYFFDMDNDNLPELCIENEVGFIYIMKYVSRSNEIILWHETSSSWTELLGSGKLYFYSGTSPVKYSFQNLDENGYTEYYIWFYIIPIESETKYLLTLPEFSDHSKTHRTPDSIKSQSIEKNSHSYYRVTKNQWDELTKEFFTAKNNSKENIKNVKFTYEELFENFNTENFSAYDSDAIISEQDAINILIETLNTKGLSYTVMREENYNGHDSYSIKAYYDEGDHVTTKGFYLVLKDSKEVYEVNMLDSGCTKIS